VTDIDTAALKSNFAAVGAHGDDVAMFFYSYLFLKYPATREMFPPAMTRQRDRLLSALGRIVSDVDNVGQLVPYLGDLGRDHRKFGAISGHYPAVGDALLTTLRHFSGAAWTEKLAAQPPYWDAEIIDVDHRTFDIAVLRVRTQEPIPYAAGQSLSVEHRDVRPREWRLYTPANAPGGNEIELHVRLISGGAVSGSLVLAAAPGQKIRLGAPFGRLVVDPTSEAPLLLVAGGTGLAPMLAIIDELARSGRRRPTHLYFGVRTAREAYDATVLERLAREHDWLSVVTAVSDDSRWGGRSGLIGRAVTEDGDWSSAEVLVCGSPPMVEATVKLLVEAGVPDRQITFEEFGEG
jgi:NAD(P)H-flavin reductase